MRRHTLNDRFYHLITSGLLIVMLSFSGMALAQDSVVLTSGIVFDTTADSVYLMRPQGGISAVNARTGEVSWNTPLADRPLALSGNTLVAMKDNAARDSLLTLVRIDASSGEVLSENAVRLPEEVKVSVVDQLGQSFNIEADVSGSQIALHWRYQSQRVQGAYLEDEASRAAIDLDGIVTFNLNQNTLSANASEQNQFSRGQRQPINLSGEERLSSISGVQFASADRAAVLASRHLPGQAINQYEWQLFDRNGTALGSVKHHLSRADFLVLDPSTMVYVSLPYQARENDNLIAYPYSIRSVDLNSGRLLWEVEVRETQYTGPYPS